MNIFIVLAAKSSTTPAKYGFAALSQLGDIVCGEVITSNQPQLAVIEQGKYLMGVVGTNHHQDYLSYSPTGFTLIWIDPDRVASHIEFQSAQSLFLQKYPDAKYDPLNPKLFHGIKGFSAQ